MPPTDSLPEPSLAGIAREWGRIGSIGFGGPPAHVWTALKVGALAFGGGFPSALLAAFVAFVPSFSFILFGAARFERLLVDERVIGFLAGAAPAAAGAIVGSAIPLAAALSETWQYAVLAAAAVALLALRRGVVVTLLAAGLAGAIAGLLDAPLPH